MAGRPMNAEINIPCGLKRPGRPKRIRGFSLLELVVVMAIIVVLSGLAMLAVGSLSGGRKLDGAISQGANIFTAARQNSISKGALTAVVILTDTGKDADAAYRTFGMLELAARADGMKPSTQEWRQIATWEILPDGVIVDNSANGGGLKSEFLRSHAVSEADPPVLPNLTFRDHTFAPGTGYSYQVFTPQGRLYGYQVPSNANPPPITLQFAAGTYSRDTPIFTNAKNYGSFVFNDATGEFKIMRP